MDLTRGAVQGNSTTARQLAVLGLAGGAYTLGTGGNPLSPVRAQSTQPAAPPLPPAMPLFARQAPQQEQPQTIGRAAPQSIWSMLGLPTAQAERARLVQPTEHVRRVE